MGDTVEIIFYDADKESDIQIETYLEEEEIIEIIKAFASGKTPAETKFIADLIESMATDNKDAAWNEDDDARLFEDYRPEFYYDHYYVNDKSPEELPGWPFVKRNIIVADSWYDVIPDFGEFLDDVFLDAEQFQIQELLNVITLLPDYAYIISDISQYLRLIMPDEMWNEIGSALRAKALNDILVEEGLLYNKTETNGRGITSLGQQKGIYSVYVPSDGSRAGYDKICYTEEGFQNVLDIIYTRFPVLLAYDETRQNTTVSEDNDNSKTEATEQLPLTHENSYYLGHACCVTSVKDFRHMSEAVWLNTMKENYSAVTPYSLEKSQIDAWKDEIHVLKEQLSTDYDNLTMIFEYVMPANRRRGEEPDLNDIIRADLILLSSDTVAVFEFKRRETDDRYTIRPARKYRKSIKRYHRNSVGMRKKAALVLTAANDCFIRHNRLISCSPDKLKEVMGIFFNDHIIPHPAPEEWMRSEFSLRK